MTTLSDKIRRCRRLAGAAERTAGGWPCRVAVRLLQDALLEIEREIEGRPSLRVEPSQGRATGRFKGRSTDTAISTIEEDIRCQERTLRGP